MRLNVTLPEPEWVGTEEEARRVLAYAMKQKHMAVDTETTGLNIVRDYIVYWSMSEGTHRWCIPAELLDVFRPFFEAEHITKIFTNAKYDVHMLANAGIECRGPWWCTLVMDWLIDVNRRHGLKECVQREGILPRGAMPSFAEVFLTDPETGKRIKRKKTDSLEDIHRRMMKDDPEKAIDYASQDAWATWVLAWILQKDLEEMEFGDDWSGWDYYLDMELPYTPVLWRMEREGITVDVGHLLSFGDELIGQLDKLERSFAKEAGHVVNLRSHKQLRELFYFFDEDTETWEDPWGKPCKYWTDGGAKGLRMPSTAKLVLEKWADKGLPLAQNLIDHRSLAKLHDTYIQGVPARLDGHMRVHTTFNQHITATGRLSSEDPNLQNIPVRTANGRRIREAFVAAEGKRLLVYDYSQLEMRILAHYSGDRGMIDAINGGLDIHNDSTARIYGIPYDVVAAAKKAEDPTSEQVEIVEKRGLAKNAGFLIVYGGGAGRLAVTAGVPFKVAKGVIAGFLDARPGIADYAQGMKDFAHDHHHVRTITGRYRHLPYIDSREDHGASERAAVNTPIQGSAGDIVKKAMLKMFAIEDPRYRETAERLEELGCKLLLQVHDELVMEIPDDDEIEAEVEAIAHEQMEKPFAEDLVVPLPIDGGGGYNWLEAK